MCAIASALCVCLCVWGGWLCVREREREERETQIQHEEVEEDQGSCKGDSAGVYCSHGDVSLRVAGLDRRVLHHSLFSLSQLQ